MCCASGCVVRAAAAVCHVAPWVTDALLLALYAMDFVHSDPKSASRFGILDGQRHFNKQECRFTRAAPLVADSD